MVALRTVQVRVKRGAELLDAKRPGWAAKINLGTLDLASHCNCILGQLFAWSVLNKQPTKMAIRNGFYTKNGRPEYTILNRVWKHHIRERLASTPR